MLNKHHTRQFNTGELFCSFGDISAPQRSLDMPLGQSSSFKPPRPSKPTSTLLHAAVIS